MTSRATPRRQPSSSTACTLVSASGWSATDSRIRVSASLTLAMLGSATKSIPIRPPALVLLKPIRVSTLARWPGGSRSSTGCRRRCGSSAMASAASSARIRASTAAISSSVRAPSSRVARSSSSSSKTSASSSGSACTRPRISVSSSLEALSSRSAIWAGFSLRMRANGPRSSALPACPMSHSKSCQSRKTPPARPGSPGRAGRTAGAVGAWHPPRPAPTRRRP